MGWNLLGGLMPPAVDTAGESERRHSGDSGTEEEFEILGREEIKERRYSGDSGNESQEEVSVDNSDTEDTPSNGANTLKLQLTQSLLSQVKASENNRDANSGKQAYKDLLRMDFVINGQVIDKNFVSQLRDKCNQNDQRQIAKHVFTKMFEHAKAEIPNDNLLEELITSCNQAGYDGSLLMQLSPIFLGHDLQLPDANDRHIEIVCSDQDSLNVKYCPNMPVKQLGKEICRVDAILEFTLKFRDSKVEYENGKVTLAIPEQLENYKADGKSLLDDIKIHFEDEDNRIIDSLVENIGEGPKSFVVDLPAEVDSDSFDIIPENAIFDLGHIAELVKGAIDTKDVNALANHIGFFQDHVTHVSPKEGLPVVEKTLEIVSGFIQEQGKAWSRYPTVPIASHIYSAKQQYYDGYISKADYEKVENLKKNLYKIKSDLIKRSSNDHNEESRVKNAQDTSAMPNETPTSSQAVSREQLNTKEFKNQQPQRNVVDKGENIMNNKKASIEEAIGNNCEEGKMPKNIEEKLSDAVDSINPYTMIDLLKELDDSVYKSTLQKLLSQADDKMTSLGEDKQKEDLAQIIALLKNELEHIDASSVGNDVEATASSQEVPVVNSTGNESELSSDDNSAETSSNSTSFDMIDDEAEVSAPEMPLATERAEAEPNNLNDEKDDQQNLTIPTAVDQGTSPIPESQCGAARNEEDFTVLSQSSSLGFANESVNTVISIDNNREEQTSNKPAEYVEQVANENIQPKSVANKQASNSNKIYTKENSVKWPTVATWMFAVTGVLSLAAAPVAYFALGTSLLVTGVAASIGAFCIVAAIAVHYYNKAPSGPLKGPDVEEVVRNAAVGAN